VNISTDRGVTALRQVGALVRTVSVGAALMVRPDLADQTPHRVWIAPFVPNAPATMARQSPTDVVPVAADEGTCAARI
jgi:hypothetical protein